VVLSPKKTATNLIQYKWFSSKNWNVWAPEYQVVSQITKIMKFIIIIIIIIIFIFTNTIITTIITDLPLVMQW
jgi:hypothetical protein